MASLIFPQLSSGAMVQYPIRKQATIRTIKNLLADGSMLVASDPGAGRLEWTLNYTNLPSTDVQALQALFGACGGPFRAFTFLDPTDNLLAYSADLTQAVWSLPAGVTLQSGVADPLGGTGAFTLTNTTQAVQQITQTILAPVDFQYCFSVYVSQTGAGSCLLTSASANAQSSSTCAVTANWTRISATGSLSDTGIGLTVGISIESAQSLSVFGPQFEPQFIPSRYRATYSQAGVYPNTHWASPELIFTADGPDLFSTSFSIETTIGN